MKFATASKLDRKSGVRLGEHGAPVQNQRPRLRDEIRRSFQANLSSRPEWSWACGPPKVMKNAFCPATTFHGSFALPFFIPRACDFIDFFADWRHLALLFSAPVFLCNQ